MLTNTRINCHLGTSRIARPRREYYNCSISTKKDPATVHLIEIDLIKKYLMWNAEDSISDPLDFKIYWGACLQTRALSALTTPACLS